jgi:hypothetical protein
MVNSTRRNRTIKLLTFVAILGAIERFGNMLGFGGSPGWSSSPAHIGGAGHHHHYRFRAHAPGDGRWHMKYHRNRH